MKRAYFFNLLLLTLSFNSIAAVKVSNVTATLNRPSNWKISCSIPTFNGKPIKNGFEGSVYIVGVHPYFAFSVDEKGVGTDYLATYERAKVVPGSSIVINGVKKSVTAPHIAYVDDLLLLSVLDAEFSNEIISLPPTKISDHEKFAKIDLIIGGKITDGTYNSTFYYKDFKKKIYKRLPSNCFYLGDF